MNKRQFLTLAGLVALSAVFVVNRGYLNQFVGLLKKAEWEVLLLVLVAQLWSYYSNAKYYQSFLEIFNYRITTKRLLEAALAINFVNQAFPSGGVSGASFLSNYLRNEVPVGKATLAQFVRYVFTFISFLAVLVLGFLLLFFSGNVSRVTVRIVLLFILLLIIVSLLLVTVVADRKRVEQLVQKLTRVINRVGTVIRRKRWRMVTADQSKHFFDEFYEGYHFLLAQRNHWRRPLLYCLSGNLAEVLTVYIVFLAFRTPINPGIVIVGYTLANVFSVLSVISSGVGIYEATMVTAFAALGVPFALALSVVIVYRVINFAVFLPLGFHYYSERLGQ